MKNYTNFERVDRIVFYHFNWSKSMSFKNSHLVSILHNFTEFSAMRHCCCLLPPNCHFHRHFYVLAGNEKIVAAADAVDAHVAAHKRDLENFHHLLPPEAERVKIGIEAVAVFGSPDSLRRRVLFAEAFAFGDAVADWRRFVSPI